VSKAVATDKKLKQRAPRKEQSGETNSPIWKCKVCAEQMFGGPRCHAHNPTPEEYEANPDAYPRLVFAVALSHPDEPIRCRACQWYGSADECTITKKRGSQCRINCPRCKQYLKFVRLA
jgi:hypothetical protein